MTQNEKMYMNAETGSVDNYAGWDYENENGETVNAVELGEVFEVILNEDGEWVEGEFVEETNEKLLEKALVESGYYSQESAEIITEKWAEGFISDCYLDEGEKLSEKEIESFVSCVKDVFTEGSADDVEEWRSIDEEMERENNFDLIELKNGRFLACINE